MNISLRCLIALSLLLVFSSGCQQRVANLLLGEWVGQPDTATERERREAEKYGDELNEEESSDSTAKKDLSTDWEAYDVTVTLDFVSRTDISFAMDGTGKPVAGTWSILQSGPSDCTIEVKTPTGRDGTEELRRYRLELDQRDGDLHGFLLTEVGSDRNLGALYFQRPNAAP